LKQRRDWFDGQLDLEPERLVCIDATWTATNTTRSHGRCPKGEHGHGDVQRHGKSRHRLLSGAGK